MDIQVYYLYHTLFLPEEKKADHPHAARYGDVVLLVTGAENPTGIVDLKIPFNHPYVEGGAGITAVQLEGIIDRMLSPETPFTADEVQINKEMIFYLYETRFKPIDNQV
jgi:hypothetical protein